MELKTITFSGRYMSKLTDLFEMNTSSGQMSPNECQQLICELSQLTVAHIPDGQKRNVAEYILFALNNDIASSDKISKLEALLSSLQEKI